MLVTRTHKHGDSILVQVILLNPEPQILHSHCLSVQVELRKAWLGHQAFEEALRFLLLQIEQACQQLQAALDSHSAVTHAAAAEEADDKPASGNEAPKREVDKMVIDLIADSCKFLATHPSWSVTSVRYVVTRCEHISGVSLCLSTSISWDRDPHPRAFDPKYPPTQMSSL